MTVQQVWQRARQVWGQLQQRVGPLRWRILLTVLLLGPAVAVIAYQTYQNWDLLRQHTWQFRPLYWGGALLGCTVALFALLWAWNRIIVHMGEFPYFWANARIYFLSNLSKRVPGAFWYVLGRVHFYRERGVRGSVTVVGSVLEYVFLAATGLLTYFLVLPFSRLRSPLHLTVAAIVLPVTVVLLQPPVFNRVVRYLLRRAGRDVQVEITYRRLLPLLPAYLVGWVAAGAGLYLMILSFCPLDLALLPDILGIWAISGTLSLLLSSVLLGSGVREIALSFLLSLYMPQPIAVLVAVAFWFVVTAADVLWAGVFALVRGK